MSPVVTVLLGLACLSTSPMRVLANNINERSSWSRAPIPEICPSSPLLRLQSTLSTLQCSNSSRNTTSRPSEGDSSAQGSSSGGWSGPHACAELYCVYTNPSFAAYRGIAVISDDFSANALANLPIFKDLASSQAADFLTKANANTKSDGVETAEIPNKGRGFVASRPIHRGAQILAYTPALVIHRDFVDDLSKANQLRLLRDAVSRLPTQTRAAFWTQLGQTHKADDNNDILDIVMTNSFNLPLSVSSGTTSFVGNFPEVSMYNHDCRPNVAFHLDSGLVHRTHAVRAVGAGEELAISYVDAYRVRAVRRARTLRNWGFACACAQCMLPPALGNASDNRLFRIWEVESSLYVDPIAEEKSAVDVVDRVELLLSLYRQEGLLESHGGAAYKVAMLNYNSLGRRELAVKYALLTLEASIIENGANSREVRDMLEILEEPEWHWSWKKAL